MRLFRRADTPPKPLRCSFCGKSKDDVEVLVAGPNACICDGCVEICVAAIADARAKSHLPSEPICR